MRFKTYLVGGAVRDELLGLTPKDLDYVVLAPSFEALRDALLADGCKIFVEKPEYNTIRAKHPTLGSVDFALARKDGDYTDGRHPDSTSITTDLVEDLSRRDFTCNAIARDVETGQLVDPFCGQTDLDCQLLKAVGDAHARLKEDRLRAFRALRFAITKGFTMATSLELAILELKEADFNAVSTERIREELFKAFKVDSRRAAYSLFREFPVLGNVTLARGVWFKPTTEQ